MFAAWLIDDVSIKLFADNAKIYSVVENVNLHSEQLQQRNKTNVSLIALADPSVCLRIRLNKLGKHNFCLGTCVFFKQSFEGILCINEHNLRKFA